MKNTNETVQSALDTIDKDKAMDHVVELLVKAFPEARDVAQWISDATGILADSLLNEGSQKEALILISIMTGSLLPEFMDAKSIEDKTGTAWEFIEIVKGDFFKKRDVYLKSLEVLDEKYMILNCDCDIREARARIYQFDALKEIGKLIDGNAA